MALKIKLRPQGRSNRPFYRVVVAEATTRRDGKYVEYLGWYNPIETSDEKVLEINEDRIQYWLEQGAQPTEKVMHLVSRGAPEVYKRMIARQEEKKAKLREKRKASKQAKAST